MTLTRSELIAFSGCLVAFALGALGTYITQAVWILVGALLFALIFVMAEAFMAAQERPSAPLPVYTEEELADD